MTERYVTRVEANRLSKIRDSRGRIWHRIGDVGWIDDKDRFWFCGRKAHRVETPGRTYCSIPCEAILNSHPDVARTALAGFRSPGQDGRLPVIFVEPKKGKFPKTGEEKQALFERLRALAAQSPVTEGIRHFLLCPQFPVDVRHNAKINREKLSETAEMLLGKRESGPLKRP